LVSMGKCFCLARIDPEAIIRHHAPLIKQIFGVCLVSIKRERERDFRELGVRARPFVNFG
jgi:hypothetical protein